MKPRKSPPKQSKRRTAEAKVYAQRKKVFFRSHTHCGRCGDWVPLEKRDLHHWAKRAGKLYLEEKLWMCLCRACHSWVHDDEPRAQRNGWLAPKGCTNDHSRALKAFERLEWNNYLAELDGVE